jgi:alcohol dehydrogenase (cytochrome c)
MRPGMLFRYFATLLVLSMAAATEAQQSRETSEAEHVGVTYEQILNAEKNSGNWLTYSGQYNGQRFSRLDRITTDNVGELGVKWIRQFRMTENFETTPLVVDGVMFMTLPENGVLALDAKSGLPFWTYQHQLPKQLAACCGKVNRGVAILGETLYTGTLDAKLVALDSRSGNVRWTKAVGDPKKGHSITGAPLIVKDMVITGIAGGEYGIRGFLDAYDARTGRRRWRTHTIPAAGDPGNETWEAESWKIGGSPTWMTGAYDPELNLLYWGVGNPGPDWNGEVRKGDNLYSDCVLAIDPDTGTIKWHFQFTPHDVHDWDSCQIPVLVDAEYDGQPRKLMLWGNRNAFYYVLDRETGEFLHANEFAKQTWATKIDDTGRPIRRPGMFPSVEGVLVYPDVSGATNWWSPTYSPHTGLFYVMSFDGAATYFLGEDPVYIEGKPFVGGIGTSNDYEQYPNPEYVSAVRALDATTGERKWEYEVQTKSTSGLLSTAGNLVFGGTRYGNFFALNATTGEELWHLDIGGWVHAAPMTYLVDGKQYVTIAAGSALFTFGL